MFRKPHDFIEELSLISQPQGVQEKRGKRTEFENLFKKIQGGKGQGQSLLG